MDIIHESEVAGSRVNARTLQWLVHDDGPLVSEECTCCLLYMEPGSTAKPPHSHYDCEEAIFVLEGEGEMLLEGNDSEEVRQGSFLLMRKGQIHMLSNSGDKPLRAICFYTAPTDISRYLMHPIEKVGITDDDSSCSPEITG